MGQATSSDAWTIGRLLHWTTGWLAQHGVDQPRLSAELLIARAMDCKKIELYTRFEVVAAPERLATLRELVRQAAEHAPIAYLVGRKEFYSLDFEVTPAVQKTIELCRSAPDAARRILDLGTGSGCVAISIARYVPAAELTAIDASAEAVEVARRNAERHGLTGRIRFAVSDWLNLDAEWIPPGGFDVIVSNPPYIAEREYADLPRNVREYEPRIALAGGDDGLTFYRRLASECPGRLRPGGSILVEIGAGQHEAVRAIFDAAKAFTHVGTYRDPADPHDRVIHVRLGAD